MWRLDQPWIIVIPILLTLAFLGAKSTPFKLKHSQVNVPLAISVTTLAKFPNISPSVDTFPSQEAFELYLSLVVSFFSISLAENALVTSLIISKILSKYRNIRVGYSNELGRDIALTIFIFTESGLITFVAQFVQILMFKLDYIAYPIIGRPVVIIYVSCFDTID